jgi:hypothetical protein
MTCDSVPATPFEDSGRATLKPAAIVEKRNIKTGVSG